MDRDTPATPRPPPDPRFDSGRRDCGLTPNAPCVEHCDAGGRPLQVESAAAPGPGLEESLGQFGIQLRDLGIPEPGDLRCWRLIGRDVQEARERLPTPGLRDGGSDAVLQLANLAKAGAVAADPASVDDANHDGALVIEPAFDLAVSLATLAPALLQPDDLGLVGW